MQAVFDHSEALAPNITTFYFKPEKPIAYTAGQFIELTVPHAQPDSRGIRRWFTLSSAPGGELVSITTRRVVENSSTYKLALHALEPGNTVHISDPMGDFVLPKLTQTPLVFVALGIGITPFLSIFKHLVHTGEQRPIRLIYAVANEDEIIGQDIFTDANQHVTIVVKEPSDAWGGERGRITAEMIMGVEEPSKGTLVYISGPGEFVELLAADLKQAGLASDQLVSDLFPNYNSV